MSKFFVGDVTVQDTLQRVAELSVDAVPGADIAGITLLLEGRPQTAVFTDEKAPEIDSTQYGTGVGPCLDAVRHNQVYRIDDVDHDRQWRPFSQAAASHGVRSVLSVPLLAGHQAIGALNLYSRSPAAFSAEDVNLGIAFATQAAILLAASQAHWDGQALADDINATLAAKATVEQAKGILMKGQGCSSAEALQILVHAAQRENRKVPDIAAELVAKTSGESAAGAGQR